MLKQECTLSKQQDRTHIYVWKFTQKYYENILKILQLETMHDRNSLQAQHAEWESQGSDGQQGRVQITRNYMIVLIKNSKTLITLQEILKIQ